MVCPPWYVPVSNRIVDRLRFIRTLLNRLRERGATVRHAGEAYSFGTQDQVCLTACGVRGWIVLTRDQRIRRRVLEQEAIRLSAAVVFALTAGEATASETAEVVAKLLPICP